MIAILRFSKDTCPIESLPENIDDVESLNICLEFINRYKSTQSYL